MARKLKPFLVETLHSNKNGQKADIMLDREKKVFFAIFDGATIEAATAEECRKLTWGKLTEWRPLEWKRLIFVQANEPFDHYGGRVPVHYPELQFSFSRFEVSVDPNGQQMRRTIYEDLPNDTQRAWRDEDELHGVDRFFAHEEDKFIPYDEQVWQNLLTLEAGVEKARKTLTAILNAKDDGRSIRELDGGTGHLLLTEGLRAGTKEE